MKLALIDFDGTLFSTGDFFDEIKKDIQVGLSLPGQVADTALKAFIFSGEGCNHLKHIEKIKTLYRDLDIGEAKKIFDRSFYTTGRFLYPSVEIFLGRLKKRSWTLNLVTSGDSVWQKKKIEKTGIKDMFEDIYIVKDPSVKTGEIKKILNNCGVCFPKDIVLFIDDRPGILEKAKIAIPEINCVQIGHRGVMRENRMADSNIAEFCRSFEEVEDFVNKIDKI